MKMHIQPDKQRANALLISAQTTLSRLNTTDILKYASNSLKDYYDIIHYLLEALALSRGIRFKGEGSHKELIDEVCHLFNRSESDKNFLQELREYRNRISYEGFKINEQYLKRTNRR